MRGGGGCQSLSGGFTGIGAVGYNPRRGTFLTGGDVARHVPTPRKQRTVQHVIADQSVNYVERYIIDEWHTPHRVVSDYGYDLIVVTYDANGYAEPGSILIQLKASGSLEQSGTDYVYDVDIRDYN